MNKGIKKSPMSYLRNTGFKTSNIVNSKAEIIQPHIFIVIIKSLFKNLILEIMK